MKRRSKPFVTAAIVAVSLSAVPKNAWALFGQGDWISGQNQMLMALLAEEIEHSAQLSTVITNARLIVGSTNELLSIARTTRRVLKAMQTYDLDRLRDDALAGLYQAIPESRSLSIEIQSLYQEGRAIQEGRFWTRIGSKDPNVSRQMHKLWAHGYKSVIWPLVLPGQGHLRRGPNVIEEKVAMRYRVSGDQARRAYEQTALGVLAKKVDSYVRDAELKDRVDLKQAATATQLSLQQTADTAEMRRLHEQRVAEDQANREDLEALQVHVGRALSDGAGSLISLPGEEATGGRGTEWTW